MGVFTSNTDPVRKRKVTIWSAIIGCGSMSIFMGIMSYRFYCQENLQQSIACLFLMFVWSFLLVLTFLKPRNKLGAEKALPLIPKEISPSIETEKNKYSMQEEAGFVCLYITKDFMLATQLRDFLEENGIITKIWDEQSARLLQFIPEVGYRIVVQRYNLEYAKKLLHSFLTSCINSNF